MQKLTDKGWETIVFNTIEEVYKEHLSMKDIKDTKEQRLIFFVDSICDLTTYDGSIALELAKDILEVFEVIRKRQNFEYIENEENYKKYIIVCNLIDTNNWLSWGGSIRGAWFEDKISLYSPFSYGDNDIIVTIEDIFEFLEDK